MKTIQWAQGGVPPGLYSPNWKPLKTWHKVDALGTYCGAAVMSTARVTVLPARTRQCSKCLARTSADGVRMHIAAQRAEVKRKGIRGGSVAPIVHRRAASDNESAECGSREGAASVVESEITCEAPACKNGICAKCARPLDDEKECRAGCSQPSEDEADAAQLTRALDALEALVHLHGPNGDFARNAIRVYAQAAAVLEETGRTAARRAREEKAEP